MANPAQQNGSSQNPEKPSASPTESGSPTTERQNLLIEMVREEKKEKRGELSKELLTEIKEEEGDKERLNLLASVLDQRAVEEINLYTAALMDKPTEASEAKVKALMFFRDTFPYLFAVLALRLKIDPKSPAEVYLARASEVNDPQEAALLQALSFLETNKELESSTAYRTKLLPDIKKDTLVLYDAAKEVLDDEEEKGTGTWMKEKIKEHPYATAALLGLGAIGIYKVGQWLYKKARGEKGEEAPTETTDKEPGFFSRITSGWSFLKKAVVSSALFAGSLFVAGRVLGLEGVEKYLKKHNMGSIYDVRILAALSHFTYGRMEEGMATMNFGPRSEEQKERHKVYAEFFGISDHSVWLVAGLKVKDLLEADSDREHPLAAGIFASIPFIKNFFQLPDQVKMEEKVKEKLEEKMELIREKIPDADDLTMDELLKKVFELRLFDTSDSAGWEGYSDELKGLVHEEEKKSEAFSETVDAAVEDGDIESLKASQLEVAQDLEQLRLARPGYWSEMSELVERVVPWFTFDDEEIQEADYLAARDSYKAFFEKAEADDLDAIGSDMKELEQIRLFFDGLKPDEPLSPEDKVLVKKYSEAMKEIQRRVHESLVRSKITRNNAIKTDAGEGWTDIETADLLEVGAIYLHAYKGVWYGLEWSIDQLAENTGVTGKVLGITGVTVSAAAAGSVLFDVAQGAMAINNGKTLSGALRMVLLPGHSLPLFTYYHGRSNPIALLEKVLKGKVNPRRAEIYCEKALEHSDVFWKNAPKVGRDWKVRMGYLEDLHKIFKNRKYLEWLEDIVSGREIYDPKADVQWQDDLVSMIEKELKVPFKDFLTRIRAERGSATIILDDLNKLPIKERLLRFFEALGQRIGRRIPRPVLDKLFQRGGAGLQYLKYFARRGLPLGVAYLTTYWVCSESYNAKDKSERIVLATTGLIAAEIGWRAVMATKFAPKHPLVMAGVALAASIGISLGAENFVAPHLKDRGALAVGTRGLGAPVLYTLGGGQLIDTIGHYYDPTDTTEKNYFTRETYLPLIGARKMAFHDGAFLAGGSYFEEFAPEEAVAQWNSKVMSEISDLKAEEAATKDSEEPIDNSDKIEKLESQIIDRDWNHRQIQYIESLKAEIADRGGSLFDEIVQAYGSSMTPREKLLIESMLVTDSPESWIDESFVNIEEEERYATIMKFAEQLGKKDELLTFLERKRLIYSDIQFYQSIGRASEIMQPSDKERLIAMLGIDPEIADQAEESFNDLMSEFGLTDFKDFEALELEAASAEGAA